MNHCHKAKRRPCGNGIAEILENIVRLQNIAEEREEREIGCLRTRLGSCNEKFDFNTRPIEIFSDEDKKWCMPFGRDDEHKSDVFRVEKVCNGTATFRVLAPTGDRKFPYEKTNSFFTVSLDCLCCIRCLCDVHVPCL